MHQQLKNDCIFSNSTINYTQNFLRSLNRDFIKSFQMYNGTLWAWTQPAVCCDCTSALKLSSSGTFSAVLHRIRDSKDDSVMMIWVRGCLDAIFFIMCCPCSPNGRSCGVMKVTENSQTSSSGRQQYRCCTVYSLLLHLITNLRN